MSMEAALQTYFLECRELLESMESDLLQLEQGDPAHRSERLNAIFRAAHTIKGSAGLFGLDAIVSFTHIVESVLDRLRDGQIHADETLISLLFQCGDHIGTLVDEAEASQSDTRASAAVSQKLGEELGRYLQPVVKKTPSHSSLAMARYVEHLTAEDDAEDEPFPVPETNELPDMDNVEHVENDLWHLSLRFPPDAFRDGMDPLSFLHYLNSLGDVVQVVTLDNQLPDLADFNPETCYLGFEIRLRSDASKQAIEDVFEFIRDDSQIRILPPHSKLSEYRELIQSMPQVDLKIGEILLECGALTRAELDEALATQQHQRELREEHPLGEILMAQNTQLSPVLEAAVHKQNQTRETAKREQQSLRVDADKLDVLINLVGELVTASAGTALLAQQTGDGALIESVGTLNNLMEDMRDAALRLRMVQIGATFSRFQRVVRDIARELNKEVELVITGADTELDKSVVEKIGDPLMHLVRNALDHGIESAEERVRQGKPAQGRVSLNAYHNAGNIIIEVSDDGRGLDAEAIRDKALEKGLISEEHTLSHSDMLSLIFEPGFSTARQLSNLSGRGVGMDVVKRNITELRGHIDVDSTVGRGTTLRIVLPLTLAIIDGFLVGVHDAAFVVPLDVVKECVELKPSATGDRHPPYINLRGQALPLVYLRDHFGIDGRPPDRQNVVVVHSAGHSAGLVVDRLMGEFQTVIKPLGRLFESVNGIGGSTIMGNGEVALILDIQGLVQHIVNNEKQRSDALKPVHCTTLET